MSSKVQSLGNKLQLEVDYVPAIEAKSFIEDPVFVSGFFGPLGCGKTSAGTMKAWLYAQAWPGARIAIIRDTMPNLLDTTQKTFFEWLPEGVAGEYLRTRRTFYMRTVDPTKPAEIIFRSMDDKDDVSNVLSLDLAAAWIDEPQGGLALRGSRVTKEPGIDHELFLLILARIGRQKGYHGICWLTGNPPAPSHWIAKDFGYVGYGQPTNPYPDYHLYLGTQETNRSNLAVNYYERLERLFGRGTPLARRFLFGEWIEFDALNPFHRSWLKFWEKLPEQPMVVKIGFDPAISESDTASRSAMVVAGQCREGEQRGLVFVLHTDAGHWSVYQQVDHILRAAQKFNARQIRVEDVQYQRALKEILEKEIRGRGIHVAVELVRPEGDKMRRASAWSPFVEDGSVLLHTAQTDLIDCMLSVPGDKQAWDLVDAAGVCITGFTPMLRLQRPMSTSTLQDRAAGYAVQTEQFQPTKRKPRVLLKNPFISKDRRARSYTAGPLAGRLF